MDSLEKSLEPAEPKLSPEKRELLELKATGLYVFHGTRADIEELTPRQAMDSETGPDGPPAVFASTEPDQAIFMAIVAPCGQTSSGSTVHNDEPPVFHFGATQETWDKVKDDAVGWVYVFKKDDLIPHDGSVVEHKSLSPIRPLRKIRVSKRDLPANIDIIPNRL